MAGEQRDHGDECKCGCQHESETESVTKQAATQEGDKGKTEKPLETTRNFREPYWAT